MRKKGQFKEIVYEWWMSTTQAKLDKNKTKSVEVNVRPSLLGQSGKSNFIIWATVCDALTCGFKSCSYNPLCVWVNARNERKPLLSTCYRMDVPNN